MMNHTHNFVQKKSEISVETLQRNQEYRHRKTGMG